MKELWEAGGNLCCVDDLGLVDGYHVGRYVLLEVATKTVLDEYWRADCHVSGWHASSKTSAQQAVKNAKAQDRKHGKQLGMELPYWDKPRRKDRQPEPDFERSAFHVETTHGYLDMDYCFSDEVFDWLSGHADTMDWYTIRESAGESVLSGSVWLAKYQRWLELKKA